MTSVLLRQESRTEGSHDTQKKRVVFISVMKDAPWGGSEQLWSDAAIHLSRMGNHVTTSIHGWPESDSAVTRLRTAGCRVRQRGCHRFLSLALKGLRQDADLWTAKRFIRRSRPDLVVISCGGFAEDLWWCKGCQILGVPYVIIAQAAGEMWWPDDARSADIRAAYRGARAVFFVSQANLSLVERMLGCRIPNASVIRNPFNVGYASLCTYPSADPTFNLACVGRLEPRAKGQDLLLEVLCNEKWRKRNLKVSFFGKGANAEGLRELSRLRGLDNVTFYGHTGDVEEIWRRHHILILPSRIEGLPLALVEAMLCGRPAVVTNVAGNTEVLDDNETGFVAAAPTLMHLDEAMERAWAQRFRWENMGREAARRIRLLVPEDPGGVFAGQLLKLAGLVV